MCVLNNWDSIEAWCDGWQDTFYGEPSRSFGHIFSIVLKYLSLNA